MAEYRWNASLEELWKDASQNPTETPHYQKLIALAQLKVAYALSVYTKWLVIVTVVVALATMVQAGTAFFELSGKKSAEKSRISTGRNDTEAGRAPGTRFAVIESSHGLLALDSVTGEACKTFAWDIPSAQGNKQWLCGDAFSAQEQNRAEGAKAGVSKTH